MNIFKEMFMSVRSVDSYQSFLKNKKFKVFLFGTVLLFFYFSLSILVPFTRFQVKTGGIKRLAVEYIPDFELKNGEFWIDRPLEFEEGSTYFKIDSDSSIEFDSEAQMQKFLNQYSKVIMADSEMFIVKDGNQIQSFWFTDIQDSYFSRQDILNYVPMVNLLLTVGIVLLFFWYLALFFFGVLFLSLIGLIMKSVVKVNLTFGQIYLLAVYTRTLPLAVKALVGFLPFGIPFFWVINFGISAVYLSMAFQKIKDEQERFNNQTVVYESSCQDENHQV